MSNERGLQKGRRKRALSSPPQSAATSKSRPRVRALSPGEPLPIKAARSQSTRSLALPNMRELLTSKRDAQPATLADMPGPKTVPVRSPSDEESSTTSEPLAEKARHKFWPGAAAVVSAPTWTSSSSPDQVRFPSHSWSDRR